MLNLRANLRGRDRYRFGLELHDLVDTEADVTAIRCDTDFCRAFHDHRLE